MPFTRLTKLPRHLNPDHKVPLRLELSNLHTLTGKLSMSSLKCNHPKFSTSLTNLPSFFKHYHPALPFLNPSKSPDEYYESGPILFWLIISIASRRYTNDILLFPVLCEWVPNLLWENIPKPPYTIPMVQAIILACAWTFPTTSMWNDAIVTLSSIAISTSMQLGLHRPLSATDFLRVYLKITPCFQC